MTARARIKELVFDRVPGLIRRGPPAGNRIALTFDDGPDAMTARYLDLLDELGVPASFFVVGEAVAAHPTLVHDYLRRGHHLGGHGYDHTRFTELAPRALLDQCLRTDDQLGGQLAGRAWVRPPYGALDIASIAALRVWGYTVALWSLDACDYHDTDPASIAQRCASQVRAGDVLLFHEGQQHTLDAIRMLVPRLRDAGYECVTMHDLFAS